MALPTLRPNWVKTFKTSGELTSRRTQRDCDLHSEWLGNYKYFTDAEACAIKNQQWTSENSFKKSMKAVDKLFAAIETDDKKQTLEQRRKKLHSILEAENEVYQTELKKLRCQKLQIDEMKHRVEELNKGKEEERKKHAESKIYERWKKSNPMLRKLDADLQQKRVVQKWKEQMDEKESDSRSSRENERRLDNQIEIDRKIAEEKERLERWEKKAIKKQFSKTLEQQMFELKEREKESKSLKEQEEILLRNDLLLEEAEEKRKLLERNRKQQEHGVILIRQYKEKMKRRSRQVQQALELDLKILHEIAEKEKEELEVQSARREHLKADAEYMKKVIEDQLRVEKTREAQLDMLYRDEAARQWRRREAEWEQEQLARERLMKIVLDERQEQIREKLENVHLQKEQSVAERERLIAELEDEQIKTARDKTEDHRRKQDRNEEIRQQISSREDERERQKHLEIEELRSQRYEEERYDLMLQKEANIMNSHHIIPEPSFRRRKIAFT